MGTVGATDVITRFSEPPTALGIDAFDPKIGILPPRQFECTCGLLQAWFLSCYGELLYIFFFGFLLSWLGYCLGR